MTAPVWNGFTQEQLDAAYNNMAAVANSEAKLAEWTQRSARLRERQPDELDVPYGPAEANRIDFFRCGATDAPLMAFIHGGWWQRNSRQVFSCMAEGPMAHGLDMALIGYTLAPAATLTGIVAEIRLALDMIARREASARRTGLLLSGWSAGGHLTAACLDHATVGAGLSISGVFDLEPIRHSYINIKLRLSEAEALTLSPARHTPPPRPVTLAFGGAELPELRRQSEAAARSWPATATLLPLAGHDHFSILEELAQPAGVLAQEAARLAHLPTHPEQT